jgi:hypothetical protein
LRFGSGGDRLGVCLFVMVLLLMVLVVMVVVGRGGGL